MPTRPLLHWLVASVLCTGSPLPAQSSPQATLDAVLARFVHGDSAGFSSVYPWTEARELLDAARTDSLVTVPGAARVVRRRGDSALGVLAAHVEFGNSGDETSAAAAFSGAYWLTPDPDGTWRLRERITGGGRIVSHHLAIDLAPGEGIAVRDTLTWDGATDAGASLRLNHLARVTRVEDLAGTPVAFVAAGGLLWLDLPTGPSTVVLEYTIDVSRDRPFDANAGRFADSFGHLRPQYAWHPYVGLDDAAMVRLTVRAPIDLPIATDLPQSRRADGAVHAASVTPVAPLALFHDRAWVPREVQVAGIRFALFADTAFRPTLDSLAGAVRWTAGLLAKRFGAPRREYLAVVQVRSLTDVGWPFMSNRVIAAGRSGGRLLVTGARHRAFFGHEVAHAWTRPSGAGRHFLSEGWATYAESLLLHDAFGAEAVAAFWEEQRALYRTGGFEGRDALRTDDDNRGISYAKGAWVLRMLEDRIGQATFDRGFRAYMALPAGAVRDVDALISAMAQAGAADIRGFLEPWLSSTVLPRIAVSVGNDVLTVRQLQDGPVHPLRVELMLRTPTAGQVIAVDLDRRVVTAPIPVGLRGAVTEVIVDPRRRLLLADG